jgi:hypothetical protein
MSMESFRAQLMNERWYAVFWWTVVGIFIAAGAWGYYRSIGPGTPGIGQIVRLSSLPGAYGDEPTVVVRVPDGSIREIPIQPYQLTRCRVGNRIAVVAVADTYRVDFQGCAADGDHKS